MSRPLVGAGAAVCGSRPILSVHFSYPRRVRIALPAAAEIPMLTALLSTTTPPHAPSRCCPNCWTPARCLACCIEELLALLSPAIASCPHRNQACQRPTATPTPPSPLTLLVEGHDALGDGLADGVDLGHLAAALQQQRERAHGGKHSARASAAQHMPTAIACRGLHCWQLAKQPSSGWRRLLLPCCHIAPQPPRTLTRMRMSTLEKRCLPSSSTGSNAFQRSVSGCTSSRGEPAGGHRETARTAVGQRLQCSRHHRVLPMVAVLL